MLVGLNLSYPIPGVVGGAETYAAGLIGGPPRVADGCEFVVFVGREAGEWPLLGGGRFRRANARWLREIGSHGTVSSRHAKCGWFPKPWVT
jgi:hypothetical protein